MNSSENTKPLNDEEELASLASKKDIDSKSNKAFKNYFKKIDGAIDNSDNRNIAITGKYGSGKSTIVDSYLKERNKDDYLKVSLAAFSLENKQGNGNKQELSQNDQNSDDGSKQELRQNKNKLDSQNAKLEQSIINQILYQINYKKIPLTNFKIKRPIKFKGRVFFLFEFLIILLLISSKLNLLGFPDTFVVHFFHEIAKVDLKAILTCVLIIFVLINIWNILKHIQFKNLKISFKNIDANLIDIKDDDNLFEKHIDEIVYLFQSSGKHLLIIEDIDRFDNLKIFQQLRELNIKLNNALATDPSSRLKKIFSQIANFLSIKNKSKTSKNKDRKWTFIYLVRDDIFSDPNDRVKFFDLIIPVVPYITTTNSAKKLKELFDKQSEKIDEKLLDILGTYIGDYRLLQNIYNEFLIFKFKLKDKDINQLLALVAYKNIAPNQFDELQNGQGNLKKITEKFRNNLLSKKNEIINERDYLQRTHDGSISRNEKELILLLLVRSGINSVTAGYSYAVQEIDVMQKVDRFIKGKSFKLKVDSDEARDWTYEELKQSNYYKASIGETEYEHKLEELNNEIESTSKQVLQNIDRDFWDDNKMDDDLLFALIKNGYINEHYLDIINNSYGSSENEKFKKNLYSEGQDDVSELVLTDTDQLVKTLSVADFDKAQILNFNLLNYLITKKESGNEYEKLKIMVSCAVRDENNFVESFLNIYPSDFDMINEISPKKLKLSLEKLEGNVNFEKILQKNMYVDNPKNLEYASKYFANLNYSEEYLNSFLKSDVYISLKQLIIEKFAKPTNINEIPDLKLIDNYLEFNKVICSALNINQYLMQPNLLNNNELTELPSAFIEFINKNAEKFLFDEKINVKFYELITQSKDVNDNAIKVFFKNYPEGYPLYGAKEIIDLNNSIINVLISEGLLRKDFEVLQALESKQISVDSLFDINEIVQIFSDNDHTTSDIDILLKISERQPVSEVAFRIFLHSISKLNPREQKLTNILENFVPINDDCSKFVRILSSYQERRAGKNMTNYRFANTEENKSILDWLKNGEIISGIQETSNNKLKIISS